MRRQEKQVLTISDRRTEKREENERRKELKLNNDAESSVTDRRIGGLCGPTSAAALDRIRWGGKRMRKACIRHEKMWAECV